MTRRPTQNDIERLTEPTRSIAREALHRLRSEGYTEELAAEVAFREAEEWETSRLPGTKPPVESAHMAEVRITAVAPEHGDLRR